MEVFVPNFFKKKIPLVYRTEHLISFDSMYPGTDHLHATFLFSDVSLFTLIILAMFVLCRLLSHSPLQSRHVHLFRSRSTSNTSTISVLWDYFCSDRSFVISPRLHPSSLPSAASSQRCFRIALECPQPLVGRVGQPLNSRRNDAPCSYRMQTERFGGCR